jgi:CheY-like chemotaxis protein
MTVQAGRALEVAPEAPHSARYLLACLCPLPHTRRATIPKKLIESGAGVVKPFRYRILLVDDERALREIGQAVLESQGYEVQCAGDGFEGLVALKQSLPDIIISDLRMPHMSGFEFLSVVRQRFPGIPVIVISGEFTGTDVPESVLADAFFEKGQYTPAQLFKKILEFLDEIPARPRAGKGSKTPVWVHRTGDRTLVAVTCHRCLRTFPVTAPMKVGTNGVPCDFCASGVTFQMTELALAKTTGAS